MVNISSSTIFTKSRYRVQRFFRSKQCISTMSLLKGFVKKSTYPRYLKKFKINKYSTAVVTQSEDKSEKSEVNYPLILDISEIATESRTKEAYYEKIKKLNTVEEKLLALNLARYYGWPSFHLKEGTIPYDFLPLTQFITRTEIQEVSELPAYLDNDHTRKLLAAVKPELQKVIIFEKCAKKFKHEVETVLLEENQLSELQKRNIETNSTVLQINDALASVLHNQYPHLLQVQIDYEPRIEAFWRVGGFYPTREDKKLRKAKDFNESRMDEYIDRFFQYFGSPLLQLRSVQPLPEIEIKETQVETINDVFVDGSSTLPTVKSIKAEISNLKNFALQEYRYDPQTYLQIPRERIRGAVIPGFWPNDPHRFGILSYHNSNRMSERSFGDPEEQREALHCQAVLASYAWVYGQACYHGFSTYYDITYPLTTQTILTDGKMFSFYQYQLNTTVLHTNGTSPENPLKNSCYGTLPEELYHDIDGDSIRGWNDKALLHLISMYINAPKERPGVDLNPYLNKNEWLIAHIKDDQKRIWLHNEYQKITSHRPTYRIPPEIYDWERIYKIENKRRVMDARKRFFEKFEDPINDRKLYDRTIYVPKKFRDPANPKKKFATLYHPDACQNYHDIV